MATPATAASDATNPEAAEVPSAAPASESEGPFDSGVVAAATTPAVVDSAVEGDAPAAPAPTSGSGPAAPSMPANPASPATPGPPRPQFAGSPAYASPPAPAFSYNVLPRPSPRPQVGSGAAQQQLASPPAMMAPSVAAAALQPPVPGQYFGNRPSFSYNVVSHANAGLPTGQQFQLDTGTNHAVQVSRFVPPSSLQPPAPMNLARPSSAFPGAGAMPPNPPGSIRLPFPGPPRPSINTFVASPQQAQPQASQLPSNSVYASTNFLLYAWVIMINLLIILNYYRGAQMLALPGLILEVSQRLVPRPCSCRQAHHQQVLLEVLQSLFRCQQIHHFQLARRFLGPLVLLYLDNLPQSCLLHQASLGDL